MISRNIKMLRQKQGLTQEQLAEKMNVSRQAVTKWESGESLPDIENVRELAEIFDVSIDMLVRGVSRQGNKELEKQLNTLFKYFTVAGALIVLVVLPFFLITGFDTGEFETGHAMGLAFALLLPIIGLLIRNFALEHRMVREGDVLGQRALIASKMPKDLLGRLVPVEKTREARKKRLIFAFSDAAFVAVVWAIIDLALGVAMGWALVKALVVLGVIVVVDLAVMAVKVRKFQKFAANR